MSDLLWFDITTAFIAGLLGSLHCIGMCGPLAAFGCTSVSSRSSISAPALFVLGKFLSYSLAGLLAGSIGAWLIEQGWLMRTQAWVSLAGGIIMAAALLYHWLVPAKSGANSLVARFLRPLLRYSITSGETTLVQRILPPFLLGVSAALLPCGLLHAILIRAAATGDSVTGMLVMQAFGIGTTPALLGIGILLRWIPVGLQRYANRFGELLLFVMAGVLVYRGVSGILSPIAGAACCP
ncbi:MAG: sulfite exporter TauE/SafE family protein [bacterium]|nr:sulfite exporter TauE/SafE family protein [bacterium]